MSQEPDHEIFYPTQDEVMAIHSDIIEEDDNASSGVINEGTIDFVIQCIEHGHFDKKPESIHEKAVELLRLLSANHPFADGNKRTALNTTWTFYALNGYYFDYGEEIKAILKLFAVMERMVDVDEVTDYFEDITYPENHKNAPTTWVKLIHLRRWDESIDSRFGQIQEEVLDGNKSFDEVDVDLIGLIEEFGQVVSEFVKLRNNSDIDLPEEVLEYIETLEDERDEILGTIREILDEISGEEVEEKLRRAEEATEGKVSDDGNG